MCPAGRFNAGGQGGAACAPCDAGAFGGPYLGIGSETGGTCSGLCQPGLWSLAGSAACSVCPPGTFGNSTGLSMPACTGPCVADAGMVCSAGAIRATGSPCGPGTYYVNASAGCAPCPAGRFGAQAGQSDPGCSGVCTAAPGNYCPEGTAAPGGAACPPGLFSGGGVALAACSPCAAGRYGVRSGLTTGNCSAPCQSGRYSFGGAATCPLCPGECSCTAVSAAVAALSMRSRFYRSLLPPSGPGCCRRVGSRTAGVPCGVLVPSSPPPFPAVLRVPYRLAPPFPSPLQLAPLAASLALQQQRAVAPASPCRVRSALLG